MQRYFAKKIDKNNVYIDDSDKHHIKNVMRMKKGDKIEVVVDEQLYLAQINNVKEMEISIVEKINVEDNFNRKITLIIPALTEQKMDLIFQKGTEMGVYDFIVAPFDRSKVHYDERKKDVKMKRWQKICKEASEQSLRTNIPNIALTNDWQFINDLEALKLVCSTNEKNNYIKSALKKHLDYDRIVIVVGPEGGLTSTEEDFLVSNGFYKVTLGKEIMRVETVPLFLASVIRYEFTE